MKVQLNTFKNIKKSQWVFFFVFAILCLIGTFVNVPISVILFAYMVCSLGFTIGGFDFSNPFQTPMLPIT